jgi:hypothetical protein
MPANLGIGPDALSRMESVFQMHKPMLCSALIWHLIAAPQIPLVCFEREDKDLGHQQGPGNG